MSALDTIRNYSVAGSITPELLARLIDQSCQEYVLPRLASDVVVRTPNSNAPDDYRVDIFGGTSLQLNGGDVGVLCPPDCKMTIDAEVEIVNHGDNKLNVAIIETSDTQFSNEVVVCGSRFGRNSDLDSYLAVHKIDCDVLMLDNIDVAHRLSILDDIIYEYKEDLEWEIDYVCGKLEERIVELEDRSCSQELSSDLVKYAYLENGKYGFGGVCFDEIYLRYNDSNAASGYSWKSLNGRQLSGLLFQASEFARLFFSYADGGVCGCEFESSASLCFCDRTVFADTALHVFELFPSTNYNYDYEELIAAAPGVSQIKRGSVMWDVSVFDYCRLWKYLQMLDERLALALRDMNLHIKGVSGDVPQLFPNPKSNRFSGLELY